MTTVALVSPLVGLGGVTHSSAIRFLPDGRPASLVLLNEERLETQDPGNGFVLRVFDGVTVHEETLTDVSRNRDQLVVTNGDGVPRFTFRVVEAPRHLALHLVRVEGMPTDRGVSLGFNANLAVTVKSVELDYMADAKVDKTTLQVNWPYLWHRNPDDPFGAFAVYAEGSDADEDTALAEIWATEPLPRPAGQESWTEADVLAWVEQYREKFAGLSEITLSAATPEELYWLTDRAKQAGIRRIYLHCDTWRGEYWPRYRTHVDVNPEVFPGGRADLVRYAKHLHERGMLLRLHSVSGGIGWHDPKRIVTRVHRELASWGGGQLQQAVGAGERELFFQPDPDTEVPIHDQQRRRLLNNMPVNYVRIGEEIIRVGTFADLDKPVWRLLGCRRGEGGTEALAHEAGTEGEGLYVPYHSTLIPDLDSVLLREIAAEYADLVNEARLDHLHFDGREIHDQYPWGWRKYTDLVYSRVDHLTTSSTSRGGPIAANFEMHFSAVRDMHELDYHGVLMPIMLAGHREATSMLDTHFCVQAMLRLGTRRVVLQKPEPMFGVTRDILENHGQSGDVFKLARQWIGLLPRFDGNDAAVIEKFTELNPSQLRQGGKHYQGDDVLVLEAGEDGFALTPTRVMVRESGDIPWRFGQEHGAIGPRQYIKPGDTLRLRNPHPKQEPGFIIHVLAACAEMSHTPAAYDSKDNTDPSVEDNYALGAQQAGEHLNPNRKAAKTAALMQPLASEVKKQRFATFRQDGDAVIIRAENPTTTPIWTENGLPEWTRSTNMANGRGLALEVDGDGSGAVLVIQLVGRGTRDYVVKIDFKGRREIIIPNGEVAWADGNWGYRLGAKRFDYKAPLHVVRMGFGYIPPKTKPHIRVARLRRLVDVSSVLQDPVITLGGGSLAIKGSISTGDYLTYDGGDTAQVYDKNWNHRADLPVVPRDFIMPQGEAPITVDVPAGASRPWISTQFITRGKPIPLSETE